MIYPPPGRPGADGPRGTAPQGGQRGSREVASLVVVLALAAALLFHLSHLDAPTAFRGAARLLGYGATATPLGEEPPRASEDGALREPAPVPGDQGFPVATPRGSFPSERTAPSTRPTFRPGSFRSSVPATVPPAASPSRIPASRMPVAIATPTSNLEGATATTSAGPTPSATVSAPAPPETTATATGSPGPSPTPTPTMTGGYPGGAATATSATAYP